MAGDTQGRDDDLEQEDRRADDEQVVLDDLTVLIETRDQQLDGEDNTGEAGDQPEIEDTNLFTSVHQGDRVTSEEIISGVAETDDIEIVGDEIVTGAGREDAPAETDAEDKGTSFTSFEGGGADAGTDSGVQPGTGGNEDVDILGAAGGGGSAQGAGGPGGQSNDADRRGGEAIATAAGPGADRAGVEDPTAAPEDVAVLDTQAGDSGAPGRSGDAPGRGGEAPGRGGEAPGRSGDALGQSGDAPGLSGEAPGQSGGAPDRSGEAPGQSGEAPGQGVRAQGGPGSRSGSSQSGEAIRGGAGDDALRGGSGDDVLRGGAGDDDLRGGIGDDVLRGGSGDDALRGGSGDDVLRGGASDDVFFGDAGNDDVRGGAGNDLFIFGGGDGNDVFNGGAGWTDVLHLDGVSGGPTDGGWTLQVEGDVAYTQTENGLEFEGEASGTVQLDDGSEVEFENVERIEW